MYVCRIERAPPKGSITCTSPSKAPLALGGAILRPTSHSSQRYARLCCVYVHVRIHATFMRERLGPIYCNLPRNPSQPPQTRISRNGVERTQKRSSNTGSMHTKGKRRSCTQYLSSLKFWSDALLPCCSCCCCCCC